MIMNIEKLQKGAQAVLDRIVNAMTGSSGEVHPQSLLCAVGSLAGYACQQDVRDKFVYEKKLPEDKVFTIIQDKQGRNFYFGDLIDEFLAREKYSVWAFAGGALNHLGKGLIDINDIFRYVSFVAGGEQFGKVRSCNMGETMDGYLRLLWKPLYQICQGFCEKGELHILYGMCVQKAVMVCSKRLDSGECARIAMESAVSMARFSMR